MKSKKNSVKKDILNFVKLHIDANQRSTLFRIWFPYLITISLIFITLAYIPYKYRVFSPKMDLSCSYDNIICTDDNVI